MHVEVTFPGNLRVDAHVGDVTVRTDQPAHAGGDGSAPSPFVLFLAAIASCAGYYALEFCRQRDLPTEGLHVALRGERDEKRMFRALELEVTLPEGFPKKYREALRRAVDQCAVKRHLVEPPTIELVVTSREAEAAALFV
jgi:ribosomal protein S12 methylthiotransferase accessory factor